MIFSVLIANYNNAKFLEECLDSILLQSVTDLEVVVVDDCSTDRSVEVINRYIQRDARIKLFVNETNQGAGYTKKRCIDESSGDICGFVDPDDKLLPGALELMIEKHVELPNASLIYSSNLECDEHLDNGIKSRWVKAQPAGVSVIHETYVGHFATFKRALYLNTRGMTSTFKRAVDHDLYCLMETVGNLVYLDIPLYCYRQHSGGISLDGNRYKAEYWDWIVKHSHAVERGINLEGAYKEMMESRIPVGGKIGRVLLAWKRLRNKLR